MKALLTFAPLALAAALRLWLGGPPAFPSDDTYISIHAARYLGLSDPAYSESTTLTGVSSPWHVVALWLAMRVLPGVWAAELLAWFGALVYVRGAAGLIVHGFRSRFEQVTAMVVACLAGSTAFHLATGLETVWALAAVMWVLRLMETDREGAAVIWLGSLMPWIRPEFVLWTAAVVVWRWFALPSRRRRDAAVAIGCVAAYFAMWWVCAGTLGPPTASAKKAFFAYYSHPLWLKLMVSAIVFGQFVVHMTLPAVLLPAAWWTPRGRVGLAVFVLFWLTFTDSGAAGLNHNYFRYVHPFAGPLLVFGAMAWRGWWRTTALALSAIAVVVLAPERWRTYVEAQHVVVDAQEAAASWLREHGGAGARVLVHDAGYLSENTSASLVDLVGLKTPSSVTIHAALTGPSSGERRGEALHEIACRANPQYYVASRGWETQFSLTYDLMRHGWAPTPLVRREFPTRAGDLGFTLYRLRRSAQCPAGTTSR